MEYYIAIHKCVFKEDLIFWGYTYDMLKKKNNT